MSLQQTLDFLTNLRENNNKAWFDDHRAEYDAARDAFLGVIAEVIARFDAVDDIGTLDPKNTMFRINRDVRFSKDKSPYKTNLSAIIGPDGRKSASRYYYIAVEPGNGSMVASGLKSPSNPDLQVIREAIAEDPQPLRDIVEAESFQQMFGDLTGDRVKTAPRGYAKDHPAIDLLRYKEYMAARPFNDDEVTTDNFVDEIIATCLAAKPLSHYLHGLVGNKVPDA